MEEKSIEKSKIKYYVENKQQNNKAKHIMPKYLRELTRSETSSIFKGRSRMIQVKKNYKNMFKDLICRGCGSNNETQDHILNECKGIHKDDSTKVSVEMLFNNNLSTQELKIMANNLTKIENKIKELK